MVVAALTVTTTACSAGDAADRSSPANRTPSAAGRASGLQPLRPDEKVLDRAEGPGDGHVAGVADDLVIFYVLCGHGRRVTLTTDFPHVAPQRVPCDGIVSRAQVYTVAGRPFHAEVVAPRSATWEVLVTSRSE